MQDRLKKWKLLTQHCRRRQESARAAARERSGWGWVACVKMMTYQAAGSAERASELSCEANDSFVAIVHVTWSRGCGDGHHADEGSASASVDAVNGCDCDGNARGSCVSVMGSCVSAKRNDGEKRNGGPAMNDEGFDCGCGYDGTFWKESGHHDPSS